MFNDLCGTLMMTPEVPYVNSQCNLLLSIEYSLIKKEKEKECIINWITADMQL